MKILIVEDDPVAMEILQSALAEAGHDVQTAGNGRQAMEILRESSFRRIADRFTEPAFSGEVGGAAS